MAKRELKGQEFIRCEAFWQPDDVGESFTGILLDVNEKMVDKMSGKDRPLYIFAYAPMKGEKHTLVLEKEVVKLKPGQIVGVNSASEIDSKLGQHLAEAFGHEVTIVFTKKENFVNKAGAARSIKRYKVELDDALHTGSHTRDGKTVTYASYERKDAKPIGAVTERETTTSSPVPFDVPDTAN
jgi:hypothetical protein